MDEMKQGFRQETFIDYITSPAFNRSFGHDLISWTPGHAKWKSDNPEDTVSLRLGHAFHLGILEPERFAKEFVILPADCQSGTKDNPNKGMGANLAAFKAQCEANNQVIMTQKEYDNIKEMRAVVHSDQNAIDCLAQGEAEVSGYVLDPEYGIWIKVRLDWLDKQNKMITDLKSCADARHFLFRSSAFDHGYDLQAFMGKYVAMQLTGEDYGFQFLCVESKGFHGLKIWEADEEMLQTGYAKYQKAMTLYKQCLESGKWPGYDSTPEPLGSPGYAKEKIGSMAIYD